MNDNVKNLHDVSAMYFFALAFLYAAAAILFRNEWVGAWPLIFMRIFDVPFGLAGLLYGGSTLYLQLNEGEEVTTPWATVVVAGAILLFGLMVFVNFAFPSVL